MAHPHRKEASEGHNAKLKRMTDEYGLASGPKNNIAAPSNRAKREGPEDAVGFGADSSKPRASAHRRARGGSLASIAARKHGGKVKHRDSGGDVDTIAEANKDQAEATTNRAAGGRTGKKGGKGGHTHVNVIVAPQGGAGGGPMPGGPPMMPPHPAMAGPPPGMPPGMPPGAPPGMPPGAPPGMPPRPMMPPGAPPPGMPMRKHGGGVHKDASQDKALIHKVLKSEGLERKEAERASGGRLKPGHKNTDAGAGSGMGRLEKIGEKPHAGKAQVV